MAYIYLIEAQSLDKSKIYKIGYSINPEKRLTELKTANPNKLSVIAKFKTKHKRLVETTLHNNHQNKNIDGEWFNLSQEEVNKFMNECQFIENQFDILKKANNPFLK